jgi:hypothetical protein
LKAAQSAPLHDHFELGLLGAGGTVAGRPHLTRDALDRETTRQRDTKQKENQIGGHHFGQTMNQVGNGGGCHPCQHDPQVYVRCPIAV